MYRVENGSRCHQLAPPDGSSVNGQISSEVASPRACGVRMTVLHRSPRRVKEGGGLREVREVIRRELELDNYLSCFIYVFLLYTISFFSRFVWGRSNFFLAGIVMIYVGLRLWIQVRHRLAWIRIYSFSSEIFR